MQSTTTAPTTNVLIVTDERAIADSLSLVLGDAGFRTAAVRRARTAVSVVLNEPVSAVVLAHSAGRLARTTSIAALLRSRPEPVLAEIAIAAVVDDAIDAAFGLGDEADAVLYRPFDQLSLVDVVTDLVATPADRRRMRRSLTRTSVVPA